VGINWAQITPKQLHELEPEKICINPILNRLRKSFLQSEDCAFFTTSDNWPLFYRKWITAESTPVDKVVVCLHGLHSHGEKFILLADKMGTLSCVVYALDLRGHGLSWNNIEDAGDIKTYSQWIRDVIEFLQFLQEQHPGAPVYIIAESMGAALAIHVAVKWPINLRSLILLSPAFKAWRTINFSMILETVVFGLIGPAKRHTIPVGANSNIGTHNKMYQEYQAHDPLRLMRITPRYNYQVLKMIYQLRLYKSEERKSRRTFYPTIVFYGGADKLVDFRGDQEFIRQIRTKEKALHFIPDATHELLTDKNAINYGIYEKIINWISRT